MRTLIGSAYSPDVTEIFETFKPVIDPKKGPVKTAPVPFTLTANAASQLLPDNPRRRGLIIMNLDSTAVMYVGFGIIADIYSFQLQPLGGILLDFVCPTDAISCFATANIQGMILELSTGS